MSRFSTFIELAQIAREHVESLVPHVKFHAWEHFDIDPETLGGGCGVSSLHLLNIANRRGMHPTFVAGNYNGMGHCWVRYDNHVVDITATQFINGCQKVHVVSLPKSRKNYNPGNEFTCPKDVEKYIKHWNIYHQRLKDLA